MNSAREISRPPKKGSLSPSFESSTFASWESHDWKLSFRALTSCAFGALPVISDFLDASAPEIREQRKSLPPERWAMTSPKLIWAGVGLKVYLPAGIASAAATRLVPARLAIERRASETGAPVSCAAAVAVRQQSARGMIPSVVRILDPRVMVNGEPVR